MSTIASVATAHTIEPHDQADADGEDAHPAIQVAERPTGEQ
jgi:hypothetical protein